jgi:predicted negative regulator of RcsB-dependent stress response
MKQPFVSTVAFLFCCAVIGSVGLFGYTRYKVAQTQNAEFRAEMQSQASAQQRVSLGTHMPPQLPDNARSAEGSSTPKPVQ